MNMIKNNKGIITIHDVYNIADIMPYLPINYDIIYNVKIVRYGYLHDVGIDVILTPNHDGYGHGWATLSADLARAVADVEDIWDICNRYGYH